MHSVNIPDLLENIRNVDKTAISDQERQQLLVAAQDLVAKVQTPWEALVRLVWVQVGLPTSCLR